MLSRTLSSVDLPYFNISGRTTSGESVHGDGNALFCQSSRSSPIRAKSSSTPPTRTPEKRYRESRPVRRTVHAAHYTRPRCAASRNQFGELSTSLTEKVINLLNPTSKPFVQQSIVLFAVFNRSRLLNTKEKPEDGFAIRAKEPKLQQYAEDNFQNRRRRVRVDW